MCRQKSKSSREHAVEEQQDNSSTDTSDLFIDAILQVDSLTKTEWTHILKGKPVRFKLDTGSDTDIISETDANRCSLTIQPSNAKLTTPDMKFLFWANHLS
jgi:hypothetical protein